MTTATINALAVARAHASGTAAEVLTSLTGDLRAGLAGRQAAAVVWFASAGYDPAQLAGPLAQAYPDAQVIGCSTAGEFTGSPAPAGCPPSRSRTDSWCGPRRPWATWTATPWPALTRSSPPWKPASAHYAN